MTLYISCDYPTSVIVRTRRLLSPSSSSYPPAYSRSQRPAAPQVTPLPPFLLPLLLWMVGPAVHSYPFVAIPSYLVLIALSLVSALTFMLPTQSYNPLPSTIIALLWISERALQSEAIETRVLFTTVRYTFKLRSEPSNYSNCKIDQEVLRSVQG